MYIYICIISGSTIHSFFYVKKYKKGNFRKFGNWKLEIGLRNIQALKIFHDLKTLLIKILYKRKYVFHGRNPFEVNVIEKYMNCSGIYVGKNHEGYILYDN